MDVDNISQHHQQPEQDQIEELLSKLQESLATNPEKYDTHIKYIEELYQLGDPYADQLRKARENMSQVFLLQENQWLDWIEDEIDRIEDEEDEDLQSSVEYIIQLFEKAVQDFTSPKIWLKYLEFCESIDAGLQELEQQSIQNFRNIYEKALLACGHHRSQGYLLWEKCREFEIGNQQKGLETNQVIRQLFQRQLSIPHKSYSDTLEDYTQWEQGSTDEVLNQSDVKNAQRRSRSVDQWEEWLEQSTDDGQVYQLYLQYIQYEKQDGNYEGVVSLYERALVKFYVYKEMWEQYASYLISIVHGYEQARKIYQRAVRMCMWSGKLWSELLLLQSDWQAVDSVWERAKQNKFQNPADYEEVCLAYIGVLRQFESDSEHIRRAFGQCVQFCLEQQERPVQLIRKWVHFELYVMNNREKAEEVMDYAHQQQLHSLESIEDWIQMKCQRKDWQGVRDIYASTVSSNQFDLSQKAQLALNWIAFEQYMGQIEKYWIAKSATEECMYEFQQLQLQQYQKQQQQQTQKREKKERGTQRAQPQRKRKKIEEKPQAKQDAQNTQSDKEVKQTLEQQNGGVKMQVDDTSPKKQQKETTIQQPVGQPSESKQQQSSQPSQQQQSEQQEDVEMKDSEQPIVYDETNTVFVKKIKESVSEQELKEFFEECGDLKEVRLIVDKYTEKRKGCAYIEFYTNEGVENAIKMDGKKLHDKAIMVAKSHPPTEQTGGRGRGRGYMGGRGRGLGYRGRGRGFSPVKETSPQISQSRMIPRAVQANKGQQLSKEDFRELLK